MNIEESVRIRCSFLSKLYKMDDLLVLGKSE
jgi:hypothetical protein